MRKQTKLNSLLAGAIFTHSHTLTSTSRSRLSRARRTPHRHRAPACAVPCHGQLHWQLLGLPPSSPALPLSPGLLLSSGSISIHSPPARQPPGSLARPAAAPRSAIRSLTHTSHLTVAAR